MQILGYQDPAKKIIDTQSLAENSPAAAENPPANLTPIYFDNSPAALALIRHSCAHLMAQAIRELYPEAKFFVGPVIEDGFYYDLRVASPLGEEDLARIEARMRELASQDLVFSKYFISKDEARAKFAQDELKQEVMDRIPDERVSIYRQGDFEDLCRGPHLPNTKFLKHFKLTRVAGAYLGGDEKREMLTRIYGTAFADKASLAEHLRLIEEAKKRDHRRLGPELGLFSFDEQIGAGLPIWLGHGGRVRARLEHMLYKLHRRAGYEPVRGPELLRAQAWRVSGHYENYKENMYFTQIDEQEYGIKPMNCVGHIKVYQSALRSYRDLPLKFFEYGLVHRHEKSGVLHGLFRVREFTQDDAHIFCEPGQLREQVSEIIGFAQHLMGLFGFEYELELSTRPDKSIGSDEVWALATAALSEAMEGLGLVYGVDEGGGAFYGPKIDIKITDALGRRWQCGTIQVDFNLPERFGLEYVARDNSRHQPVMLHRAILGSFERFIGILIEHCGGELPFFIAPVGVGIVPINEAHLAYAKQLQEALLELNVDSEIYEKNESLSKRIRLAEGQKVPMIVVIGDEELATRTVALRDRRARQQSRLGWEEFLKLIKEKVGEVRI